MESRAERAVGLFLSGYNCCQSVFAAYSEAFGMDREMALKVSCSMGGGIGRMREVCGAVSGMAMIAGLACGNTDPGNQEAKTKNYETVRQMADQFKKAHKTIICREILGLLEAEESAAPSERTESYYRERPCARMVETAARIIEETFPDRF
ncbi:MAG: C_GCAxxG_C_C family protein [Lachnospiraceae bacterium]|jgi:C_GCAxxG_C_C family probable redox protein|nr:C_GCAxxG_C_C family protein [Lachnospiraceae bacterium]